MSWAEERARNTGCFDVQRFDAIPSRATQAGARLRGPECAWDARRRHAPCTQRISPSWGMDCVYLRVPREATYVEALHLRTVQNPAMGEVGMGRDYLVMSKPLLPYHWTPSGRKTSNPELDFPLKGLLQVPSERYPRDSAYSLYLSSLMAGHGDPGRFIEEHRKEYKNRRGGVLLSWSQVEYYLVPPGMRRTLYPVVPAGWDGWECPIGMTVPLPAVVTYRGSRLIRGDPLHWGIFYSEWLANVMARFVDDAFHRGLLWHLPARVVENLPLLGLEFLLEGSPYPIQVVEQFLRLQADCDWDSWTSRGYGTVGAVPIHLVGRDYKIQELGSLMDTTRPGTRGRDEEVEEVIAHGVIGRGGGLLGVSGNPQRPPVRPITGTLASPRGLSNLPRERNLEEDYEEPKRRIDLPVEPEGLSLEDPDYVRYGDELWSRNTLASAGLTANVEDQNAGYTEEERRRYHSQRVVRIGDLEQYFVQAGCLDEAREVIDSYEWTTEAVGVGFLRLLESRRYHRQQAERQRQRISTLEEIIAERIAHGRETAVRMNRMVGEMANLSGRCHEGPRPRVVGEAVVPLEQGQEGLRKRPRNEDLGAGEWGAAFPRR
jgi:hypothetical protein